MGTPLAFFDIELDKINSYTNESMQFSFECYKKDAKNLICVGDNNLFKKYKRIDFREYLDSKLTEYFRSLV